MSDQLRAPSPEMAECYNEIVDRAADLAIAYPPSTLAQAAVNVAARVLYDALGTAGAQQALRAIANELPEMVMINGRLIEAGNPISFGTFEASGLVGRA